MKQIDTWKRFNETHYAGDKISGAFGSFGDGAKITRLGKLVQYIIQGRDNELNAWGNLQTIEEVKKYINQIPKEKLDILKKKNSQEIQKIFQNSLQELYNYLDRKGVL